MLFSSIVNTYMYIYTDTIDRENKEKWESEREIMKENERAKELSYEV